MAEEPYDLEVFSRLQRRSSKTEQSPEVAEMARNRAVMRRQGNVTTPGPTGANVQFATGRPRDPLFYWKQNNLPYDLYDHQQLMRVRAYCNTPEAPILMGDGTFKPIGEIQVGEQVIGWEWEDGGHGRRKRMVTTPVVATNTRTAPMVIETTMESGQIIRCTPDHQWSNFMHAPSYVGPSGWQTPEYKTLFPETGKGTRVSRLAMPVEPLTERKMIDAAGYLAGMIDADGSVAGGEIRIGQSPRVNSDICARIEECLNVLGLDYRVSDRNPDVRLWALKSTMQNRLRLRAWMPLSLKVQRAWENRVDAVWTGGEDRPISHVELGAGEVVSMQTGTGNYVAWGLGSKNCRLLYQSHPMIGSCIDIYTKYPLLGMELTCKDEKLTEFYSDLFGMGTDDDGTSGLNYPEFFIDFGREYWTVGEAVPFGSFNESLGIWDDEELLNPDDLEVQQSPFLKEPRYFIRLPESLRDIITKRSPAWEFQKLMEAYPELSHYTAEDALMPVSAILLRQYRFKADTFNKRGVPLLMRALRPVMQEEMMNAALDSVADRLYTPLILARLGASATDLGTTVPWIPTAGDLEDFEEALDNALAADFRVLVHHFGIQMESVFGRENMPDLTPDFERIEDRILQTFGLSKTMLTGASSGQTYAADALNRDLISQLLGTYQALCKRHYRQRALVVAEAQEHYDYDERNGKRYVKMEEILEIDDDGNEHIVEQPKLLIPDMNMRTMNIKDEEAERQFMEALRAGGIPISMKTRLVNIPIDFDDEIQRSQDEAVQLAVAEQETRKQIYNALVDAGLPIPQDLDQDFRPRAAQAMVPAASTGLRVPMFGVDGVIDMPNMAPTQQDEAIPTGGGTVLPGQPATAVDPFQPATMAPGDAMSTRPPESDEMRADMPKAASASDMWRAASRMRTIVAQHYSPPTPLPEEPTMRKQAILDPESGEQTGERDIAVPPADEIPRGRWADPKHIGLRRHAAVTRTTLRDTLVEDTDAVRP